MTANVEQRVQGSNAPSIPFKCNLKENLEIVTRRLRGQGGAIDGGCQFILQPLFEEHHEELKRLALPLPNTPGRSDTDRTMQVLKGLLREGKRPMALQRVNSNSQAANSRGQHESWQDMTRIGHSIESEGTILKRDNLHQQCQPKKDASNAAAQRQTPMRPDQQGRMHLGLHTAYPSRDWCVEETQDGNGHLPAFGKENIYGDKTIVDKNNCGRNSMGNYGGYDNQKLLHSNGQPFLDAENRRQQYQAVHFESNRAEISPNCNTASRVHMTANHEYENGNAKHTFEEDRQKIVSRILEIAMELFTVTNGTPRYAQLESEGRSVRLALSELDLRLGGLQRSNYRDPLVSMNGQNSHQITNGNNNVGMNRDDACPTTFQAPEDQRALQMRETINVFDDNQFPNPNFDDQTPPELFVERRNTQSFCLNEDGNQHQEWAHRNFEWTTAIEQANIEHFGNKSFRKNQREIINAVLSGRDVFVLMPTGGGKSLCYQLPAAAQVGPGVAFVISPLVSLIQDQMHHLSEANIPAASLSGKNDTRTNGMVKDDLKSGSPHYRLVYVTPERLAKDVSLRGIMESLHRNNMLRFVVIDEAHCVSTWGHDFRKDYTKLHFFKTLFPNVPIMALTATATKRVQEDIKKQLGLRKCVAFQQSFNRQNLRYEVRKKKNTCMDEMIEIINQYKTRRGTHQCGIVYCLSRDDCERVAKVLQENGIRAAHYHANLSDKMREEVQAKWTDDRINVICATIAFGMGINKPDVRFVIHHSLSKSLEGYHQEAGRAGRDGLPARCILFYSYKDSQRIQKMILNSGREHHVNNHQTQSNLDNLRKVLSYCCNTIECRRVQLLAYFDDKFDAKLCKQTCDNCAAQGNEKVLENRDMSDACRDLVGLVQSMDPAGNQQMVIDVYRGSKSAKVTKQRYHLLEHYAKGSNLSKEDCERLIQKMLNDNVLEEDLALSDYGDFSNVSSVVRCGQSAMALLQGYLKIRIPFRVSSKRPVVQVDKNSVRNVGKTNVSTSGNERLQSSKNDKRSVPKKSVNKRKRGDVEVLPSPSDNGDIWADEPQEIIDVDDNKDDPDDNEDLVDDLRDAILNLRNEIAGEQRNAHGDTANIGGQVNASHIWSNGIALKIAKKAPKTVNDLTGISGLSVNQIKKYGERIISTINDALELYMMKQFDG